MAFLDWRGEKKLTYTGGFILAVLFLAAGITWLVWPKPTCFDAKMNDNEEGIDCGGPCIPCLKEIRPISVLWTRFFKGREGIYDLAALIENPNIVAGLPAVKYQFKLYDENNIVMAIREGTAFINPGERKVIFETGITIGPRTPKYAYIEFIDEEKNWKYVEKENSPLSTIKKEFINFPFPRVTAVISNESLFDVKDIFVSVVLYDSEGNAIGVSSTKLDLIPPEETRTAFFTWPIAFEQEPSSIEIFSTTNLTVSNH